MFDVSVLTPDFLVAAMLNFMTHTIFEQIVLDSDRAFAKSDSLEAVARRERELFQSIKVVVDRNMAAKLAPTDTAISVTMMQEIQNETITEVWSVWKEL